MSKIIRINMTNQKITKTEVKDTYSMLGGRGLTSKVILDEVKPDCHPLGEFNKIVIAPGLLTGTSAPSCARLSIGAKSPLTGGIKESNAGGTVSAKLAKLGIHAIIVEGQMNSDMLYSVLINKDEVKLIPIKEFKGLGNYETVEKLQKNYGEKVGIISIGQAGEMKLSAASIAITDREGFPSRHCGRGGLGAVLGSKNIKAIIIDDSGTKGTPIKYHNQEKFNNEVKDWTKELIEGKKSLSKFGTTVLVDLVNEVGGFPTRNFNEGVYDKKDKINGKALLKLIKSRNGKYSHSCSPGCVIRCSNVINDANGNYLTSGLEYETIALCGSNLEIDDLDVISIISKKCDDYGIDTMEIGVAMGVAMEAGVAKFGDGKAAIEMVDEIGNGTYLGRILGQGSVITGEVFGVKRVPAVKGQSFSAYDPRAFKGNVFTYSTTPMGADHTAGNCLPGRGTWLYDVIPHEKKGYIEVSRDLQIMSTVLDIMGFCNFVGCTPDNINRISRLMKNVYGKYYSYEDIMEFGKDVIRNELEFNHLAGFTKEDDRMPEFIKFEKLPNLNVDYDIEDKEIDEVLNF